MIAPELRLATRRNGRRDGELVLVSPSHARCVAVPAIAATLQAALDDWDTAAPALVARRSQLDAVGWTGAEPFDPADGLAPLPRAYQWADASVYRNHARLIYKWRKEPIPPRYEDEPLVYQGGSDVMLGPTMDIEAVDESHGIDLEAEDLQTVISAGAFFFLVSVPTAARRSPVRLQPWRPNWAHG